MFFGGLSPVCAVDLVAPTEPLTAVEQQKRFHLPPGFTIQLVAAEPDIQKPMNLNFDARGRLFVTDSIEYPYPAEGDAARRDTVKILEDLDDEGRAGKFTVFADGLNIPIGVTPTADGAMFHSIPNIYLGRDADGDGQAEAREVLYGEIGHRDTHGMASSFTRWIDGWIYACHGFSNTSTVRDRSGGAVTMNSGNTFRMAPDGSRVQQFTHGQVNPFGLAFDPLGNLYSADCHSKPVYMLLRGAYYPSFGKPHDGLGYGPTMIDHDHGSTGIGGIAYYAADHFPAEYRDTIFLGNPVTGRVNHDRLEPHGSTYLAVEQPDFITCDDPWFRPVDLQLGPDGALYIADFYNRIIGHYEVPLTHPGRDRRRGRIWRVIYTGVDGTAKPPRRMPDLTRLIMDDLITRLGDENLTVRTLATEELIARDLTGETRMALEAIVDGAADASRRVHALWTLERTVAGGATDERLIRLAQDQEVLVRVHVMKMAAERGPDVSDRLALCVRDRLADKDAFVRRAAADALGRYVQSVNIVALLRLWRETPSDDTHLIHVARMALRDTLWAPGAYEAARSLAEVDPDADAGLADVSLGLPDPRSAAFVLESLRRRRPDDSTLERYLHHATRYASAETTATVYEYAMGYRNAAAETQNVVLLTLERASAERGESLPVQVRDWAAVAARTWLASDATLPRGVDLARQMKLQPLHTDLAELAADGSRNVDVRSTSLEACAAIDAAASRDIAAAILADGQAPAALREQAAALVAGGAAEEVQPLLIAQLKTAPEQLAAAIALGLAGSRAGGERLLTAVQEGAAPARVLQDAKVEERLRAEYGSEIDQRLARLTAALAPRDEQLAQMVLHRAAAYHAARPDPQRGREIFGKHCAACHRLEDQGNKVGPELTGIGVRGLERLLEDVLDPSRNVDQAFRGSIVITTDGRSFTGLAMEEQGRVLVLVDQLGKEQRIPLDTIDERGLTPLSPMPANFAETLSETELNDLLGYLLGQVPMSDAAKP